MGWGVGGGGAEGGGGGKEEDVGSHRKPLHRLQQNHFALLEFITIVRTA